jgi:hypothetical protein
MRWEVPVALALTLAIFICLTALFGCQVPLR